MLMILNYGYSCSPTYLMLPEQVYTKNSKMYLNVCSYMHSLNSYIQ